MPGSIQKHTLVYTVVLGLILTAFFDLSRIAALGIVFYLIMDTAIHWGVLRYLRDDVQARVWVPVVAVVTMIVIAVAEQIFLKKYRDSGHERSHAHDHH